MNHIIAGFIIFILLTIGCLTTQQPPLGSSTPPLTSGGILETPLPAATTQLAKVILEETKTVSRNEQIRWQEHIVAGKRVRFDIVTDGASVDYVVLESSNYDLFASAFASKSGSLWDEYLLLGKNIIRDSAEFKVPLTSEYYFVIENADVIPGGAMTVRNVNVTIKISTFD